MIIPVFHLYSLFLLSSRSEQSFQKRRILSIFTGWRRATSLNCKSATSLRVCLLDLQGQFWLDIKMWRWHLRHRWKSAISSFPRWSRWARIPRISYEGECCVFKLRCAKIIDGFPSSLRNSLTFVSDESHLKALG